MDSVLPPDMLFEVARRLPPGPLRRFRATSRACRAAAARAFADRAHGERCIMGLIDALEPYWIRTWIFTRRLPDEFYMPSNPNRDVILIGGGSFTLGSASDMRLVVRRADASQGAAYGYFVSLFSGRPPGSPIGTLTAEELLRVGYTIALLVLDREKDLDVSEAADADLAEGARFALEWCALNEPGRPREDLLLLPPLLRGTANITKTVSNLGVFIAAKVSPEMGDYFVKVCTEAPQPAARQDYSTARLTDLAAAPSLWYTTKAGIDASQWRNLLRTALSRPSDPGRIEFAPVVR